jgi:hypothetical protein
MTLKRDGVVPDVDEQLALEDEEELVSLVGLVPVEFPLDDACAVQTRPGRSLRRPGPVLSDLRPATMRVSGADQC